MIKGYLIAKNSLNSEFFTSRSAYDRPMWLSESQATVYATAELADAAVKKLYKYGAYQAHIIVAEMNLDVAPIEEPTDDPEGDESGSTDELDIKAGSDENDDDGMEASNQEDVCPECGHEPCTCGGDEHGDEFDSDSGDSIGSGDDSADDIDIDSLDLDDIDIDIDNDEDEQEADPRFDGRRLGMAQLTPMGLPRKVGESVQEIQYKDKAQCTQDDNGFAGAADDRVKIPADVKSELASTIKQYEKEAEFNKTDDARASFCLTVAAALTAIKNDLDTGTIAGIKAANIKLSSYMSPIVNNVPASVIKFINKGGVKPSLKDMFDSKRYEKR